MAASLNQSSISLKHRRSRRRWCLAAAILIATAGCSSANRGGFPYRKAAPVKPEERSCGTTSPPGDALIAEELPAKLSPFQLAAFQGHGDPKAEPTQSAAQDLMELSDQAEQQLDQDSWLGTKKVTRHPAGPGTLSSPNTFAYATDPETATKRPITQNEVIAMALASSPVLKPLGLRILAHPETATTVFDTGIAASDPYFGPQAALAEFDSVLSASVSSQNNDRVFNNATLGGDVQELLQDYANLTGRVQKRSQNGAIWDINTIKLYDNNNRTGNIFPNYWETQLEAGVRQPLLRGAGREFNLIAGPNAQPGFNFSNGILIARLNNRISDTDFEIAVRTFVRDLYAVYWDLKRQYRHYDSVIAARDMAYQTWQSVLARSEAKLGGGEANKEAQSRAKYYRYCREAEMAIGGSSGQGGVLATERRLRQMIGLPNQPHELLFPVDEDVLAEFSFDLDTTVARAMMNRSELKRQRLKVQQQELRLVATKNFLLPQLDLIGRYRLRGFGDDLTGDGERFSSAYKDFFSLDHQEFEFGVEMGVVAGQRQARAAVRNATLQLAKDRSILLEQQRTLQFELTDAVAEVETAFDAMEFSRLQAEAVRARLKSSEVLFEADKIQIEFLLDAQEDLLQAELSYATDLSRYALSLVSVSADTGSLLQDLGIVLQRDCNQTHLIGPTESIGN
ncbi:TolC family protein [Novipirellula artificiosorum]|uniref:TolC family protein n=1 Tax=Novipirellula artificiosorum TaxID=2528016 RepID=UPI001E401AEB|nr:TolC family protein [Novipirellula artificiosorum]